MNKVKTTEKEIVIPNPQTDTVLGTWVDANGVKRLKQFKFQPGIQLIGKATVDMNTTGDQIITLIGGSTFAIADILYTNATASLNSLTGQNQAYTQVNSGGSQLWNDGGDSSGLTNSEIFISFLNQFIVIPPSGRITISQNSIYFNLTNALGTACKMDIYIYGYILE